MDGKTYTGVVKKVMDKGYGFIRCDELNKDVFYHNNNLPESLKQRGLQEGVDKVTFTIEQGPKGDSAMNIQLVGDDSAEDSAEMAA